MLHLTFDIQAILILSFSSLRHTQIRSCVFSSYGKSSHIKVVRSRKLDLQEKIDNFAFKNSNIVIEGLFWKRKDYFP